MKRLSRAALLTKLVPELKKWGSWAGETHIQKAAYLLQHLLGVPFGYSFVLYRHGPFSFELRDELTALRADALLALEPQRPPYGPRFTVSDQADDFQKHFPQTISEHIQSIEIIAEKINNKNVADLEKITTAFWVSSNKSDLSDRERVDELVRLKPHITRVEARHAFRDVQILIQETGGAQ